MNIVVLNDSGSVNGGAAKIALDGARALASVGHQVHLVCGTGSVSDGLRGQPNLTVHHLAIRDIATDPNRLRAMAIGIWNPASSKYLGELLDSLDPQSTVVHVHNWTRTLSVSAVRSAIDRRFAVIFTLHDFQLACPTGTLFRHNLEEKCTLKPMSASCICTNCDRHSYQQKLWRIGRHAVQQRICRIPSAVKHFVYYSQLARDVLAPFLPNHAVFYWLPVAIDMEQAPPANVYNNETFLFLGRLVREKGPELFARAAAAEQVQCRFVGEGIARESIERANPKAILSGWVSHHDGLQALRSARVLVFPSLWYETLGLTVLEAAGNGVPSIVPDSCAARQSVVDGVTGLYFRSGDERDLRAKIALLKNAELAARMGKAAYDLFWTPPGNGIDLHRQRLERIYKQALDSRESPSTANESKTGSHSAENILLREEPAFVHDRGSQP
jgi:glycosyltransferase involved in cell wall biosynthesis